MDPSKRARVESQVAEWLRYGDDLGLGPFYRDRAPIGSADAPVSAANVVAVEAENSPIQESFEVAPAKKSEAVAASSLPMIGGSNLFEGIDRLEGDTLAAIREFIGDCTRCKLYKGRNKIVFGVGNPKADLVFVGEGPGRDEDLQGEPFVGRAGKLLTQMIEAMSLRRDDVYIANVVKCRPPENRLPEKDEIATCSPFLMRQLDVIRPKVICCLGSCSAQTLLQTTQGISKFRGEWFEFRGAKLIATYHPAYLLRTPSDKRKAWEDLKFAREVLARG